MGVRCPDGAAVGSENTLMVSVYLYLLPPFVKTSDIGWTIR